MIGIVGFHVLMLLLGLGIIVRVISAQRVSTALTYLHTTIGITTPPLEQVPMIALIWIGSILVIVDGCLLFFVFITKMLN